MRSSPANISINSCLHILVFVQTKEMSYVNYKTGGSGAGGNILFSLEKKLAGCFHQFTVLMLDNPLLAIASYWLYIHHLWHWCQSSHLSKVSKHTSSKITQKASDRKEKRTKEKKSFNYPYLEISAEICECIFRFESWWTAQHLSFYYCKFIEHFNRWCSCRLVVVWLL